MSEVVPSSPQLSSLIVRVPGGSGLWSQPCLMLVSTSKYACSPAPVTTFMAYKAGFKHNPPKTNIKKAQSTGQKQQQQHQQRQQQEYEKYFCHDKHTRKNLNQQKNYAKETGVASAEVLIEESKHKNEEENPLSAHVVDDNRVASNTMDRTMDERAKRQKTSVTMAEGELLAPPS
ncbi:hypothetical protein RUM44_002447 [Polyplax serrata]|uniref:Uncharacterized protein n=1 Tax=Polyplax serrata TaxID=468196 RepID=A0ABR1AEV5_POLSC